MTAQPAKAAIGAQRGNPPSLEWLGLDRLAVDPSYQRATDTPQSRKIIARMVKGWDWALCQPLVVSRRNDGSLWILDGQHRHAGARQRGDIPHLPCVVLGGIDHAEEAHTFVALNEQRQRLSQADIFFGMLAAGNADAKAVQDMIDQTRWRVIRSRNTAARLPGELDCAPMLVRMMREKNAEAVRFALTVLRAAYPETPVRQVATMLTSLGLLFVHLLEEQDSAAGLIAAIARTSPESWIMQGKNLRERRPTLSGPAALAHAMLAAARGKPLPAPSPASVTTSPASPTPAAAKAAATTAPLAFGLSGKGWCSQCEQLVTRDRAAACRDSHCKGRTAAA